MKKRTLELVEAGGCRIDLARDAIGDALAIEATRLYALSDAERQSDGAKLLADNVLGLQAAYALLDCTYTQVMAIVERVAPWQGPA